MRPELNNRRAKVLKAVFADPVPAGLAWADIEGLLVAAGCKMIEGSGSHLRFEKDGMITSFHRPKPPRRPSVIRCAMPAISLSGSE